MLVADDQTELCRCGDRLEMTPPATIAGLIEVRGLGIVPMPHLGRAALHLVVDLAPSSAVERLPEPRFCEFEGVSVPLLALDPFTASAPAKLRLALCTAVARGASPEP